MSTIIHFSNVHNRKRQTILARLSLSTSGHIRTENRIQIVHENLNKYQNQNKNQKIIIHLELSTDFDEQTVYVTENL